MNTLKYINNMGITPMPEYEKKTLKQFIANNQSIVRGMDEATIYKTFKNTLSFAITRVGVAFSGVGIAITKELKDRQC